MNAQAQKPGLLANLFRLSLGFVTGLLGLALYQESSWPGFLSAAVFAFLLVLGVRWGLLGVMGFLRPLPPRKTTYGVALLVMVVLTGIGPTVSASYQKSHEPEHWQKALAAKEPTVWQMEYKNKVGEPFRRAEYVSRECEAYCAKGLATNNFEMIRNQAELAFVKNPKSYDDQARKAVSDAWAQLQAEGLKKVKPTKLADPALAQAFKDVLEALAANPSRKVQFHYEAGGGLGKLADDRDFFASIDPKYRSLPILPTGDAFSPEAHLRRSGEVRGALQSSFNAIWPKGMLDILSSKQDAENQGDVNFWVKAQVRRISGFYTNTENNKINSLLYKCEVLWTFRITLAGKELGRFSFRSEPAKHVSYSTKPSDPKWAPYSIIMDSAADNFARLIVGRLGLTPPPVRENYEFAR